MAKTLIEVLAEQGIELQDSSGGRKTTHCMFHEGDNEASFTVYPNQSYYCFGCNVWGDAVKFLIEYKELSYTQALEYVGADYKTPKVEKTKVIKVKNPSQTFRFLYDLSLDYHNYLLETPGALNYLKSRGLSIETIKKYKLGYTDGHVLNLQTSWEMQLALEIGLVNRGAYEILSHRITIPNITEEGYADFIIGRTVTNDTVRYLGARMPKPIHGFYEVRHSPIIFLAEGQMDWLTLRQWGYPAAVIGGSTLKKPHEMLLKGKKLVLLPDYDEHHQGENTMSGIQKRFGEDAMILDYSVLKEEVGKLDINSLTQIQNGEEKFRDLVESQVLWLTSLSKRMRTKWFPNLADTMLLGLT